jgi:hypothetical protein
MANDKIVATLDGNFVRMIDGENPATITDVQNLDYKIKVFESSPRLRLCSE